MSYICTEIKYLVTEYKKMLSKVYYVINFKCLLMPGLKVGGMVQIQSRKLPLLNGLYKVQTLIMQGGNRSTPYFCNIFAIRM